MKTQNQAFELNKRRDADDPNFISCVHVMYTLCTECSIIFLYKNTQPTRMRAQNTRSQTGIFYEAVLRENYKKENFCCFSRIFVTMRLSINELYCDESRCKLISLARLYITPEKFSNHLFSSSSVL